MALDKGHAVETTCELDRCRGAISFERTENAEGPTGAGFRKPSRSLRSVYVGSG